MKRQRGRGRKSGGGGGHHHNQHHNNSNPNRTMESNGPDTKVRGPAAVIYERYLQLARDAASSGDRVLSENYLQHADHYFRLVRQMQPAAPPPQPDRYNQDREFEGAEDGPQEGEELEEGEVITAEAGEQPDAEFPQGQQQQFEGDGRRRRGRRNRYRGNDERGEGAEARDGPEERTERSHDDQPRQERQDRRERRPPREDREQAGPEGFSSGPKPAFLRGSE